MPLAQEGAAFGCGAFDRPTKEVAAIHCSRL